jgi:lysozyme
MYPYREALQLIKTFEGFHEKAYADSSTADDAFIIGYGTSFYPDGAPVKQGHLCTKQKATEYLLNEVNDIARDIKELNLGLDDSMLNALISFVHSIGWKPFLYSNIVDLCDQDDFVNAAQEITKWIFDDSHQVIGGLVDRRRHEVRLFLQDYNANAWTSDDILLKAFRDYTAAPHQVRAIRELQEAVSPYILSSFANTFDLESDPFTDFTEDQLKTIFNA